ncbi:hypothetical protein LXL04_037259 [Taraxacum kok-saghyz]
MLFPFFYCETTLTMAETARKQVGQTPLNGSKEVVKEKWVKHYSSNHHILLVGEGDFSFALSLAKSFGRASNIVASSLDSYGDLIRKYKNAKENLDALGNFGAQLLHGVNAIKMKNHTDLRMRKFDRILFNFPHLGIKYVDESNDYLIMEHKNLVQSFLWNARFMLLPKGEIHVTHRTEHPYNLWNIEELATPCVLDSPLVECVDFQVQDYPGYNNKEGKLASPERGLTFHEYVEFKTKENGDDEPFPLGKCSTFKFTVSSNATITPPEFPKQTQLKQALANLNPYVVSVADGLIYETICLIPDPYE